VGVTFIFNFIPTVGSLVAMVLPLPIVLVDDELATWLKVLAFLLPASVQMYVGNVLEPQVFGKSLNRT
jgi:AI-2 transport protein TqsA